MLIIYYLDVINVFLNFLSVDLNMLVLGSLLVVWIDLSIFLWFDFNYVKYLFLKCVIFDIGILFKKFFVNV